MAKKKKERNLLQILRDDYGYDYSNDEEVRKENTRQFFENVKQPRENNQKETKRSWFNQGLFDDGYQFGDITKTTLGTTGDIAFNLGKGITGVGEGLGKLLAGGVAKVSDLVGADDLSDKIKNRLAGEDEEFNKKKEKYFLSEKLERADNKVDKFSILGEKADDLTASAGNLAVAAAGQSVGIPWYITSGVSTAGNELENAYQNGATDGEAWLSTGISTASELLTEKISGGISFGGKTLDSSIKNAISKGISNKVLNKMTQFGFDAFGEGAEEILSEIGSQIGRKLSYESDKSWKEMLTSEEVIDNYIESFIGGAFLGGIGSLTNIYKENKISQLQEQQLNDIEQRQVQIEQDYQNGLLTEEEYNNEYDKLSNELKIFTEENNKGINNPITEIEADQELLQEKLSRSIITEEEYNKDLSKLNEKLRKISGKDEAEVQPYQYEETDNQKVNNMKESASKYFNNQQDTHDLINTIEKVIKDKNYNVLFDDTIVNEDENAVSGRIATLENGEIEIRLNPNSERSGEFLLMHEVTHAVETEEIKNLVMDYAKQKPEFNKALEDLKKVYKTENVSDEVLADVSGQLFGNQEFINNLSTQKPNIFKRIYNSIISVANKITGNSNEALFMRDLKNKWENAYRETTQEQAVNNVSNTKFAIKNNSKGKYVKADRQVIKGNNSLNWEKQVENYINEKIRNNKDVNILTDSGEILTITKDTAGKAKFRNSYIDKNGNKRYMDNNQFYTKLLAEVHIDELAQISKKTNKVSVPDYKNHSFAKDGFDYRSAFFEDNNGDYYKITMSVGKNGTINTIYNVGKLEQRKRPIISGSSVNNNGANGSLSVNTIPQSSKNVKSDTVSTKYSMQNSKNDVQTAPKWQKFLDDNFKATGTRTNMNDISQKQSSNTNTTKTSKQAKNGLNNGTNSKDGDTINLPTRLELQIENALKNNQSNNKSYLGKVTSAVANKIKSLTGIDVSKRTHVLSDNDIRHMLKQHGNEANEKHQGQIAITKQDIKNIPDIISNPSNIIKGTDNKNEQTVRYIKRYNSNTTYVVEVVPDKSNTLQIKTMWKKPSTLANDITTPSLTSETQHSDISSTSTYDNTTTDSKSQTAPLPIKKSMQQTKNNTQKKELNQQNIDTFVKEIQALRKELGLKESKILNPSEISKLKKEDASTTPKLPNKKVTTGEGKSKFADNILNKTNMLSDTSKEKILAESSTKYYQEVTNKESMSKALDRLENNGRNETLRWLSKDSTSADPTDVAEGWILMKQYQDSGDYDSMVQVAKKMREIGTKAGQTVQAFNIMERMTPEGMVKYAQSELSDAYDKMVKNKSREWIEQNREKFDLKPEEVQFIMDNMKEISTMEDGYDKKVKLAEIQKIMTDKLPPERGAGIKSWMRMSMLFNPKTQVRNVLGNAIISPVNMVGDRFSATMDKMIAKKTGVRTTGTTSITNYVKGMKTGLYESYNDFKKGINTRNIEGNRFEIGEGKSFNDNTKLGKSLNKVDSVLSFMLDAGDRIFYEASFTNSINNQLILNNTDVVTQDMIDIATTEALQRTWQDNNGYTKLVLDIRRGLNKANIKGYGLGDALIPFAKTPANLTKALIDYSPAGMISAITSGINLKRSLSNGQFTPQMQHKFVQNLGKATAGTMLYVIGYALAKSGALSGDSDDDKDVSNFMKNTLGINNYSLKIGNKTFTYDWAQPIAGSFSIMANYVQNKKENEDASNLENLISSLDIAGNILLEQSFMESINTVLNNNDGVATGLQEAVLELPSRAIPTFSKQIADMIDKTQRTTFEKNEPLKTSINKVKAKLPGLSKTLAPSIDTLGREIQKYGGKNNIFNVFFNPANVNNKNVSESAKEIYRLYQVTGDKSLMPRVAPYDIKITSDEKKVLTSQERASYQKEAGSIIEKGIKELFENKTYNNLSDEDKAEVVKDIINYAYNKPQEKYGKQLSNEYRSADLYVNKGGTISEYYSVTNKLKKYDNDYKDAKEQLNSNSSNYSEQLDSLQAEKRENIINEIINTKTNSKAKALLYEKYYGNPKTIEAIINSGINFDEYLKFMRKEYTSDKYANGKTITNSRKKKVFKAVESLKLSIMDKAMLIRLEYPSFDTYNVQIINKVNSLQLSKNEKSELLKQFGFKIKGGRVYW